MFKPHRLKGGTFFGGGMFFQKTPVFEGWYVYLGRYVFEKLLRKGGGTFIWDGTFIWHWIVLHLMGQLQACISYISLCTLL